MLKPLAPLERRVIGVLIEKVLSTPQAYPLTLNLLVAGCNQKSNRDPEMDLLPETVQRTLDKLQAEGHVVSVYAEGQRTVKYKTTAKDVFALPSEKAMAVLSELLLRGPQTKAELRSRASRMRHEISLEDLEGILNELLARPEPLIVNIGRAPGGRAERFAHTLYPEDEIAAVKASGGAASPVARMVDPAAEIQRTPGAAEKLEQALAEIEALRGRVEALERAVSEMRGA